MYQTNINPAIQTAVIAGVSTAILIISFYLLKTKKDKIPKKWKPIAKVTKIFMYPLKSARRYELQEAECTEFGLRELEKFDKSFQMRDRSLAIYKEADHELRTSRNYPKLMLVEVQTHDMNYFTINAPDMRTLFVKIPEENKSNGSSITQFQHEQVFMIDCGDEAANWISNYLLDKPEGLRMGYNNAAHPRDIRKLYAKHIAYFKNLSNKDTGLFSDLTSMHLINQSSVDDLNKRMGDESVTYNNFRPTILVEDSNLEAYAEEKWDWIKVGDNVIMRNVMDCTRCMMTTIHPELGTRRTDREPLKTLEKYKMSNGPEKSPVMGIHLGIYQTGIIKVGDTIYVEE